MLPLPEVPLAPEAPLPLPPDVEPLPMLPLPMLSALPELLEPLEPELPLLPCFLVCFFLLDLWVVDELPLLWSCAVAPGSPVDELLVCAWAFTAPNIAMATEAPNRPFNTLFIFMSLS
jgi:signal-induced proliferation-associated 1 like protein 3